MALFHLLLHLDSDGKLQDFFLHFMNTKWKVPGALDLLLLVQS